MKAKDFDACVKAAIDSLPPQFLAYLDNVLITVQDEPSDELLDETDSDSLLGIYLGVPLTERSLEAPYQMPDQIILFQGPLEDFCETEEELVEEIRITVVHEIGHFFGLEEDEIVAILGE